MTRERIGEVVVDGVAHAIEIDPESRQIEADVQGHVAFILFRTSGSELALIHTEVPPALRGKSIAEALARAALDYARSHQMTVKPICPFVARFVRRHQEYQDLVAPALDPSSISEGLRKGPV